MVRFRFLIVIFIYIVLCISGFNALILQQENILRRYFVTSPQERIKEYHATISDSLFKYFIRENKESGLEDVAAYIKKYGRTSLFETSFIYKDENGRLFQISKAGIEPISGDNVDLSSEKVYPISIAGGRIDGYLVIAIKETKDAEYAEGMKKYRSVSSSLRVMFLLFVFALAVIALYHSYSRKMRLARDMAEAKASSDGLTGLYTHEYFVRLLQIEIEKFKIYGLPIGLIMLDVDKFKLINDEHGHVTGDKILQEVAGIIKSATRSTDICGRYGGEEVSILMPSTHTFEETRQPKSVENFANEIKNMAERIRRNIETSEIVLNDGKRVKVTVSMGIALSRNKRLPISTVSFLEKADAALYKAKGSGRNRIFVDQDYITA